MSRWNRRIRPWTIALVAPLLALGACFADFDRSRLDGGDATDGDADGDVEAEGGEVPVTCGNGVVDPGEDCDDDPARDCATSCGSTGTQTCTDCRWDSCSPPFENCNGNDDDCDTETDEGYPCAAGSSVPCAAPCGLPGTGVCTVACELPSRGTCAAAAEACNGCDDTRDGTTDEGCACATGWVIEHPLAPGPQSLRGISIAPDGSGFVVGSSGVILRYDGTRWQTSPAPGSYNLEGVHALSADFAVAVGGAGSALWWDGTDWTFDATTGVTVSLYGVFALAQADIWAVGANGTSIHWNGTAWSTVPTGSTVHLYEIQGFATNDVYAAGRDSTVLHWNGTAWTRISPSWGVVDVLALWGPAASAVYAGTTDGHVRRYDSGSGTWLSAPVTTGEAIDGLWGTSDTDIWAIAGWTGGTFAHWDGTGWTEDRTVPSIDVLGPHAIAGNAADNVFVMAHDGGILHYDGTSWRPMEGAATVSLHSVWGASPQDVFAVGTASDADGHISSAVLRYDGTFWRFATASGWLPTTDGRGIWAASPTDALLVAADDLVRRFDGTAWATHPTLWPDVDLFGVWGTAADQVVVVGGQDIPGGSPRVMFGTTGSWTPLLTPDLADVDLLAVSGTSVDDAMAVGTGGTILRRSGDNLEPAPSGTTQTLRGVWVASATEAFAVGDNGTILHWNGTSWTSMTVPADPWASIRLDAVWGSSSTNVFAVGGGGMLLRYDGMRWTEVVVGITNDLTAVWGSSSNNVFVVANDRSGKILHRCGAAW